ncbi:ankyrin-repeat protein, partial [Volvox carteri f. nagariensis]
MAGRQSFSGQAAPLGQAVMGLTSRSCGRSLLDAVRNNSVEAVQDILGSGCDDINQCDNQQNSPLILAASKGSVALVRLLLGAGADASRQNSSGHTALTRACAAGKDNHGNTALLWCARTGNAQLCRLLIDAGANVNQADTGGRTPIFHACVANSLPVAEQLIAAGADLGVRDTVGKCAFDYAQNPEMRTLLLSSGSFPEGSRRTSFNIGGAGTVTMRSRVSSSRPSAAYHALTGAVQAGNEAAVAAMLAAPGSEALMAQRDMLHNSVLHVAASRGLLPIMVKLLELARQQHVDIDEPNIDGHTALYLACRGGHRAVVQVLLGAGALPNVASREASTPLHACAAGGHADIVRLLLDRGANLNAADSHANTPLLRAAELGHANLLLAAGANPNISDNVGETPLIEAATAGALNLVQTLVAHGVDVQACNHIGETALMRASVHSDPAIVDELIAVGARLDAADRELGFTALMYAASQGSAAVVGRLLAAGAAVGHANNMGISALLLASRSGYLEVVDRLLQAGASIDQADLKGYTPLMVACVGGYMSVVSHLLRAGANVNLRNYEGYTALSAAMEFGQKAVAELLVRHGADASAITGGGQSGYGAVNGNSSLKAAAGSIHPSSQAGLANSLHGVGNSGQMALDGPPGGGGGGGGGGAGGSATSAGLRLTAPDMAASVANRAATASSLQMHLDGLPNSVLATSLPREGSGVPAVSGTLGPLVSHTAKFIHELDAYDLLQRRNSRNA